jgi:hypothetical protein
MARQFPVTNQPEDQEGGISYSVGIELNRFTGSTLVIGDTIFMSDEGVELLASTDGSYYAVNAYSFIDSERDEIGGMYGRDDSGQNVVGFRVVDQAGKGDDTLLQIASTAQPGAEAQVTITANQDGGDSAAIILQQDDSDSKITILAGDFVRFGRKLNLLGPSNELCDLYIKGAYFILAYNTGAQIYYKYLDLSSTSPTWQHSTAEP